MTFKIHDKQTADAVEKSPEARFNYFIFRAVKSEEVWTLADENGFVISETEGERSIPVWPHAEFASEWIQGDWAGCQPLRIEMAAWRNNWLPGLAADGVVISVFPKAGQDVVVVDSEELIASFKDEYDAQK
jgi:hypothetical protein